MPASRSVIKRAYTTTAHARQDSQAHADYPEIGNIYFHCLTHCSFPLLEEHSPSGRIGQLLIRHQLVDIQNCQKISLVHKPAERVFGEVGIDRVIHDTLLDRKAQIALHMTEREPEIHARPAYHHAVVAHATDIRAFPKQHIAAEDGQQPAFEGCHAKHPGLGAGYRRYCAVFQ